MHDTDRSRDHLLSELTGLEAQAVAQVRTWQAMAASVPVRGGPARLAELLRDPLGLPFAVGFVDEVIRPEDVAVAAHALQRLAGQTPRTLPLHLRAGVRVGAAASRLAPGIVVPIARAALRRTVAHLLVDARDQRLGKALARLRGPSTQLNVNLLGEAVLGRTEAQRRLAGVMRLVMRPDVQNVSVKVSSVIAPHSPWGYDEAIEETVEVLLPLYLKAAGTTPNTFITLDMEEYRDLDLTLEVFTRLLDRPELHSLSAGVVLQAYLPDSLAAMLRLQEWAGARRARGGAPVKVRLVKGANLPLEQVDAELHGWPQAPWPSKLETDTHYKRVLLHALRPDALANVRVGVASHNLFDVAFAWHLAQRRGAVDGLDIEMLLGMAPAQAAAVRETVGRLLLYVPVVHPAEFDVAVSYLVRRLDEASSQENYLSAAHALDSDPTLFRREEDRFRASVAGLDLDVPAPRRSQDRSARQPAAPHGPFRNAPDSDPSTATNRSWAREVAAKAATSELGEAELSDILVTSREMLDEVIAGAEVHSGQWAACGAETRAKVLRAVAVELEGRRAELLEVMASECGKTLEQGDAEVSEAVDFAAYYAERAVDLEQVDGAVARPVKVCVVTPPWNFPIAIPAGETLAVLATGSAVVLKPAPEARRCAVVLAEALWAAGVSRDVLRLIDVEESSLGSALVSDPRVGRVLLTGAWATAEIFGQLRPQMALLAETSGKNALVVTPSADLDLAVRDLVASAFGHAGQKCSAASLAILVGQVARSPRFRRQLVDAVNSLRVGLAWDLSTQMGPLVKPAEGALLRALTTLEPGEQWWVKPVRLDERGQMWSPGVKGGVRAGSQTHLVEFFGPVLGIMEAASLKEALAWQNAVDYGLTAGIHSLDVEEVRAWIEQVEAGNLYVNRVTTGAVVQRQPFGGWKRSAVGPGTKAGGPNHLVGLVDWESAPARLTQAPDSGGVAVLAAAEALGSPSEDSFLSRAVGSDALAWREHFSRGHDPSGLSAERNVLRYRPVRVAVRVGSAAEGVVVLRVVAAALTSGAEVDFSFEPGTHDEITEAVAGCGVRTRVEDGASFLAGVRAARVTRVRLVGVRAEHFAEASGGDPSVAVYGQPVVEAGRIEMLPFLVEQVVSITAHRFGTPRALAPWLE